MNVSRKIHATVEFVEEPATKADLEAFARGVTFRLAIMLLVMVAVIAGSAAIFAGSLAIFLK